MKFNNTSISFIDGIDPKELLEKNPSDITNPRCIICPHAGYIFSGNVAASVFNTIDSNKEYDNVFILSTSHTTNYRGASCLTDEFYETPYGNMSINNHINKELIDSGFFQDNKNYFLDHTIEVILPFIYHKVKYKSIVPIMVGDIGTTILKHISEELKIYHNFNNLFIISSDFSHYPPYDLAVKYDNETKDLILRHDPQNFIKNINNDLGYNNLATRMCGWSSYLVFLYMTENYNFDIEVIRYMNSGQSTYSGTDRVVGYFGITFNSI